MRLAASYCCCCNKTLFLHIVAFFKDQLPSPSFVKMAHSAQYTRLVDA